ncbi:hypothetical protein BZG05_16265, partial [Salinivibrio kushneri]|uniref:glycosyltransferase n=1 Tax=Salinivibrio kushneri TaxID=1908198 RepID=UPI0009894B0B
IPHDSKSEKYFPFLLIKKISSKLVFVSKYTKDDFNDRYGDKKPSVLINHGIMPVFPSYRQPSEEKSGLDRLCYGDIVFWGRVEKYKGVDIFENMLSDFDVYIFGKWAGDLENLRLDLYKRPNVNLTDAYLNSTFLDELLGSKTIFVLPYRAATQSGVLYSFLAYGAVFISTDVGENGRFLNEYGLKDLLFDRDDEESIVRAYNYAYYNYSAIKTELEKAKEDYMWHNLVDGETVKSLYSLE